MTRLLYNLLFFVTFSSVCLSQTRIDTVKILIKDTDKTESIFSLNYKNRINNYYLADSIKINTLESFFNQGYIFAEIKEYLELVLPLKDNQSNKINILVEVEKGKIAFLRKVSLQNKNVNAKDEEKIIGHFDELINKNYSSNKFEQKLNELLTNYQNNGYPFAEININSFLPQLIADSILVIDISLKFEKNSQYIISDIDLPDSVITNKSFIKKITKTNKKIYLNKDNIDLIQSRLSKQKYFTNIKTPTFRLIDSSNAILKLYFNERKMNNFDGLLGFVPESKNSSGYFTGFIKLKLQNLFGSGRDFSFDWSKHNSLSQEFLFSYYEPFLFNSDFALNLNYNYQKQDSLYSTNNISLDLSLPIIDNFIAGITLGYETSIPGNFYESILNSTNALTTGLFINYDSRDKVFNPKEGMYLENIYKYSNSKDNANTDFNLQRYELNLQYFLSLTNKNIIALKSSVRYLITSNPSISYYYYFGGNNTLRGYREKQFVADKLFWSNFEYRFFFEEESYLFSFFDVGYYDRSEIKSLNISKQNELLYGFGLGIGFSTNFGVFNVSYAVGKNESFSDGKIHLGVNTNF